jgi:hypothetical protein
MENDQGASDDNRQKEEEGKRVFVTFEMREDMAREIVRAANNGELLESGILCARIVEAKEASEQGNANDSMNQPYNRQWGQAEDKRRSRSPDNNEPPLSS